MPLYPSAPLKNGAIGELLDTDHVSTATRRALIARLSWSAAAPGILDATMLETLRAVAARLIPQVKGREVDLAARLDAWLARGEGDGWRYNALPPDHQAMRRGLAAIERTARARFGGAFTALSGEQQDELLRSVQTGEH